MARLFEIENDKLEQRNKLRGFIISVLFHAAFFLLLYCIVGVSRYNPPLDSDAGGVMVNLGYMDNGMGDVQPTNIDKQMEVPTPVASTPPPEKSTAENNISTNRDDAPVITKKPVKKPKKEIKVHKNIPVVKPTITKAPPVVTPPKPRALYTGGMQNNSPGEGNGNKPGDKGQTNGSPGGDVYTGNPGIGGGPGGPGNNPDGKVNYKLSGRRMLVKPKIDYNSQETGSVVLKITVDKSGKVISADGPAQGSTTTSNYLLGLAKKAALGTRFDSPSGVPDEQFGTITFNFRVK